MKMSVEYARIFWRKYLNYIRRGRIDRKVPEPVSSFKQSHDMGKYDGLSQDEFSAVLDDVEAMMNIWISQKEPTVGNIFLGALAQTKLTSVAINQLADILSECSANSDYLAPADEETSVKATEDNKPVPNNTIPKEIYDYLNTRIHGQHDAKKAASMVIYNLAKGCRSNTVFIGPTGCGKSEIWRQLSAKYPSIIRIIDASRLTADGWKGSFHIENIFDGIDPNEIAKHGLIIVLDEADKVFCETIMGSSGTNFSALVQNELLKMMDGDKVEFESTNSSYPNRVIDCSKVSFVMLGAFESVFNKKKSDSRSIGFGKTELSEDQKNNTVSPEHLLGSGMRRELLGRINRIVFLEPLSVTDYETILSDNIITDFQEQYGCKISINKKTAHDFAAQAFESGLGVRHMRSLVLNVLDEKIFESPFRKRYAI